MKLNSAFLLFILLSTSIFADNGKLQLGFVNLTHLSEGENLWLSNHKEAGTIEDQAGVYVVVFPDDTTPLMGEEADQFFLAGNVNFITFSGLPNNLVGSLNLGKRIAKTNNAPVLAVHSGYGDFGVYTQGPKAFFVERLSNKIMGGMGAPILDSFLEEAAFSDPNLLDTIYASLRQPYVDDATNKVNQLLLKLDGEKIKELNIVAYCLGAFKAANLSYWLEQEQPKLLAKMNFFSIAISVFPSKLFNLSYQLMGNRDQFGRINSTNPLAADILIGKDHTIRADLAIGLPIPPVIEMKRMASLRDQLLNPPKVETWDLLEIKIEMDRLITLYRQVDSFLLEAANIANGGPSDTIHMMKLTWEKNIISSRIIELFQSRLDRFTAQPNSYHDFFLKMLVPSEDYVAAWYNKQSAAENLAAKIKEVNGKRTSNSDLFEYLAWKKQLEKSLK